MKFITLNKKNLIISIKFVCILLLISNITPARSNLKNYASSTSATSFLNKLETAEVKDPKSLFKPEAQSCRPAIEVNAFEDSYPRTKKNFFDKLGFNEGPITYLIDFMEEAFEKYSKNVQKEFKQIFDDAKQVTPTEGVKDPYYLAKIATQNGTAVEDLKPEDYYRIIKERVPRFNSSVYEASITIPQLVEFFKTNKWTLSQENLLLEAKTLVDKFDFNGDGRLNFREFIIAMIFKTEDLVRAKICTKCLEIINEEIIEPIFSFIDCERRNMISAEEIWNNLKYLIRRDENTYNIFTCKISNELYRTSSINDFVLKAHKSTLGYLTRNEFRTGLFLAFWDRYVGDVSLKEEEENIRKTERWGNSGKNDNICGNIHKHIQVIQKEISEFKHVKSNDKK
jgi:Ca2+-binding EF-hand superfamily protein